MIPVTEPWLTSRERELVVEALRSNWISPHGEFVDEFEERFASVVETEYAFATSSGTAALHLALVATDVGSGDEVIVPDLTWISCANVVRYVDAEPVFVDVDERTFTMDPESVRDAISPATRAILPVHLFGHPCDMDPLLEIATEHDLVVIEDGAQAHGATYRSHPVGSMGDLGCFSFYGNKLLTTGQGGMITTNDATIAERIELFRRDGMSPDRRYYHPVIGYNYRLTNLQAAVGVGQVERLNEIVAGKRQVAGRYRELLSGFDLEMQAEQEYGRSVNWMNPVVFESATVRDEAKRSLEENDVETRPFFYPLQSQPPYRDGHHQASDRTMDLYERGLILPSGPRLDGQQIERVVGVIADVLAREAP